MKLKTQTLEALMNQGFRKAFVESRHVLVKDFIGMKKQCIEIYEVDEFTKQWNQVYFGEKKYVERYITPNPQARALQGEQVKDDMY